MTAPARQTRAEWRRDLLVAEAHLFGVLESMSVGRGDPAHRKSLRLMVARLNEIRGEVRL